jgi:hypothetical protein
MADIPGGTSPSAANVLDCRKEVDMNKHNLTILYSRLSGEDDRDGVSGSIENQKMLLEAYAVKNDFTPFVHIYDDGHTGTNWQRPGWQKVMEEIESGRVQTLIIKNLDRISGGGFRLGYRKIHRAFVGHRPHGEVAGSYPTVHSFQEIKCSHIKITPSRIIFPPTFHQIV